MSDNKNIIEKLYTSFSRLDWKGMRECYHKDAVFYDPVFENLNHDELIAMWKMLCERAKDFNLQYSNVKADGEYGTCSWIASYLFSQTGRKVVNNVKSHFRFHEGLIVEHMDDFNLWKWSRQALGNGGLLLGWSSFLQKKIRSKAKANLHQFMSKNKS
jgi:ketosteroid isomerase-like protein